MTRAFDRPIVEDLDDGVTMSAGADRTGRQLEVGVSSTNRIRAHVAASASVQAPLRRRAQVVLAELRAVGRLVMQVCRSDASRPRRAHR